MWENSVWLEMNKDLRRLYKEITALREEFWKEVRVPGSLNELNQELEKRQRADFIELGELMCKMLGSNRILWGTLSRGITD